MKLSQQFDKEITSDYVTKNIQSCIEFWNNQHADIHAKNLTGELGTKETNAYVESTQYDDWLNEMIFIDCKTFCNSKIGKENGYECGRTRSHVWVHKNNERFVMIYADKN